MKKINFSFHNLLNNDKILMIISLIIAFCLWVTVSPQRDININCPVTLSTNNFPAEKLGLEIIEGAEQNINVTVSGEWYTISELTPDDITISYSLGGIVDSGDYEITITATKTSNSADFVIESITPEKVKVSMDYISTVRFPIEVVTDGITAADDLIVGTPIVDNGEGEIEITGPVTVLNKLTRVVAEIDAEETLSKSKVFTTELKFLNKNNKEINTSKLTLPYTEVDVIVPINQIKTVPIKAQFINAPAAYSSKLIPHKISMQKIELVGTTEALSNFEAITLDAIDFKELTVGNNKFVIALDLPSGITASNGVTEVTVTVDLSDFTSKTFNLSKFKTINVKKGTNATVETSYKSVVVVGPKNVISQLDSNDVYIECDMSSSSSAAGSVIVEGVVKSNKYKTIWGTGDCEIRIKVSEK